MDETTGQKQQGTIAEVICPLCYEPLPHPAILEQKTDDYSRTTRRYFGWCFKCNCGYEVMQFLQAEKWYIHKYQIYRFIGNIIHCAPIGEEIEVQDLPIPAPVVLGPGGEYNKSYDFNAEAIGLLHKLKGAMAQTLNVIDQLIIKQAKNTTLKDE